jgi:hypothetical protein
MAWARISDDFHDHPKVAELASDAEGLAAMGLWVLTLAWVRADWRRAGIVPIGIAMRLAAGQGKQLASRLVQVRLWDEVPGGWQFHDFKDVYTPEDVSKKRAEAGRRGGVQSGLSRRSKQSASQTKQNRSKPEAKPVEASHAYARTTTHYPLPSSNGSSPYSAPGRNAHAREEPPPTSGEPTLVERIMTEYRDNSLSKVPSRVAEQLAQRVHELISDGMAVDHIREALPQLRIRRLGPNALASLVDEIANRSPSNVVAIVNNRMRYPPRNKNAEAEQALIEVQTRKSSPWKLQTS